MKLYVFERGEVWCKGMNKREIVARERLYGKLLFITG